MQCSGVMSDMIVSKLLSNRQDVHGKANESVKGGS